MDHASSFRRQPRVAEPVTLSAARVAVVGGTIFISGVTAQLAEAFSSLGALLPMSAQQAAVVQDADIVIQPTN